MADADAQAGEVGAAVRNDVAQAVVAAVPAAALDACRTRRQVEFVVDDQEVAWRELVVVHDATHGLATLVHERARAHQPHGAPSELDLAGLTGKLPLRAKALARSGREFPDEPETDVVAVGRVPRARIAEADNYRWELRHLNYFLSFPPFSLPDSLAGAPFAGAPLAAAAAGAAPLAPAGAAPLAPAGALPGTAPSAGAAAPSAPSTAAATSPSTTGTSPGSGSSMTSLTRWIETTGTVIVRTGSKLGYLDARRQLEIGQMEDLVQLEVDDVELEVFGEILRQAGNGHFREQVVDDSATLLDALRIRLVEQVQGHADADPLGGDHALEIHVQDLAPGRVDLDILENALLLLTLEPEGEDAGEKRLFRGVLPDLMLIEQHGGGYLPASIHDAGNLAGSTQAAARTSPRVFPRFQGQTEALCHGITS